MFNSGYRPTKLTIKARAPKTAARVAAELRREIVTGNIRPGEKLRQASVLQVQFGISRPTLREALRLLEADSLISVKRGQFGGAEVMALDPMVAARQVGMYLQMDGTTLEDVWEARLALEPVAARLLAKNGGAPVIKRLEALLEEATRSTKDPVHHAELQAEFSHTLVTNCGNKTLQLLGHLIHEIVRVQQERVTLKTFAETDVGNIPQVGLKARRRLVDLIQSQAADEAEAFWKGHLQASAEIAISMYRAKTPINML